MKADETIGQFLAHFYVRVRYCCLPVTLVFHA